MFWLKLHSWLCCMGSWLRKLVELTVVEPKVPMPTSEDSMQCQSVGCFICTCLLLVNSFGNT